MRRALPLLLLSLCLLVSSCGSSDPVFARGSWLVRCPETDPPAGCINGKAHDVAGFADDEGISASCAVTKDGDMRSFQFRITDSSDPAERSVVAGRNIIFSEGGPVTNCQIEVQEAGNTYRADGTACGAGNPSDTQPCQIRDLTIDRDADPRPKIEAQILCRGIVVPSNPTMLRRDLTGASPGVAATFEFDGCDGNVL